MMKVILRQQILAKLNTSARPLLFNAAYFSTSSSFYSTQKRFFALTKYNFEDEHYQPNRFQVSIKSHKSNAEELINDVPVVEVVGDVARCTGVNELGLGHPVQYIQLDRRNESSPVTCKWCGLRFKKSQGHHHHEEHHH